jgi:hypothetical protein
LIKVRHARVEIIESIVLSLVKTNLDSLNILLANGLRSPALLGESSQACCAVYRRRIEFITTREAGPKMMRGEKMLDKKADVV